MMGRHRRIVLSWIWLAVVIVAIGSGSPVQAQETSIRIMPPDNAELATGQRFDLRVEATAAEDSQAPRDLRVFVDGLEITSRNILDATGGAVPGDIGAGRASTRSPSGAACDRCSSRCMA